MMVYQNFLLKLFIKFSKILACLINHSCFKSGGLSYIYIMITGSKIRQAPTGIFLLVANAQFSIALVTSSGIVYKSRQPVKSAVFSARFRRLLSLLHESRYVGEMMFIRSHNRLLFTKLWLLKTLKKTLQLVVILDPKLTDW